MKKDLFVFACLVILTGSLAAGEGPALTYGIHAIAGGRYDDVRMCVGSPAGVKGGPIMDVYLDVALRTGANTKLVFNLPVMRPVLFGAAFGMLQFEPQVTLEYTPAGSAFVFGGGLGTVFHYGPDYKSSPDDRGEDFFALGPLVSLSIGRRMGAEKGYWQPGAKVFYSPLFSADQNLGWVLGAALELHYRF